MPFKGHKSHFTIEFPWNFTQERQLGNRWTVNIQCIPNVMCRPPGWCEVYIAMSYANWNHKYPLMEAWTKSARAISCDLVSSSGTMGSIKPSQMGLPQLYASDWFLWSQTGKCFSKCIRWRNKLLKVGLWNTNIWKRSYIFRESVGL